MYYDLGIAGLGLLILLSLAFGLLVQFVGKAGTSVDWLVAGIGWFVGGLLASELVVGQAAQRSLDGLALDAVVIGGGVVGVPVALALRLLADRWTSQPSSSG